MTNILKRAIEIITGERPKNNLRMNGFLTYISETGVVKSISYSEELDKAVIQAYNERKGIA